MGLSRRRFLQGVGTSIGGMAAVATIFDAMTDAFAAAPPSTPTMTPNAALRTCRGRQPAVRERQPQASASRRQASCGARGGASSLRGRGRVRRPRVPPEVVYDEGLGVLFTVRIAGNTAEDPLVVGSVEVHDRESRQRPRRRAGSRAVWCGEGSHRRRGQRHRAARRPARRGRAHPARRAIARGHTRDELLDAAIKANVRQAVSQLSANDMIADTIAKGTVKVVGRQYLLTSGKVVPTV